MAVAGDRGDWAASAIDSHIYWFGAREIHRPASDTRRRPCFQEADETRSIGVLCWRFIQVIRERPVWSTLQQACRRRRQGCVLIQSVSVRYIAGIKPGECLLQFPIVLQGFLERFSELSDPLRQQLVGGSIDFIITDEVGAQ